MNANPKNLEFVSTQIETRAPLAIERTTKSRRAQLRMTDHLMLQLSVIKVAEGGTSSEFCSPLLPRPRRGVSETCVRGSLLTRGRRSSKSHARTSAGINEMRHCLERPRDWSRPSALNDLVAAVGHEFDKQFIPQVGLNEDEVDMSCNLAQPASG